MANQTPEALTDKANQESVTSTTSEEDDMWNMDLSDILRNPDVDTSRRSLDDIMGNSSREGASERLTASPSPQRTTRVPRRTRTMPHKFSKSDTTPNRPPGRSKQVKRSVSFDKVKVRVFERVLADNPPSSSGPSLGLGWNYNQEQEVDVEQFESKAAKSPKPKRSWLNTKASDPKKGLIMPPDKREKLAKKLGFSSKEIKENVKMVERVLRQRQRTKDEVEGEKLAEMADYSQVCIHQLNELAIRSR